MSFECKLPFISYQEFDHQASRQVRQMFQAIEQMLFEGVLSGSITLQHECREWMSSFPHLRILGKQVIKTGVLRAVELQHSYVHSSSTARHTLMSKTQSVGGRDVVCKGVFY